MTDRKPHPDHYRAAVTRAGGVVRRSVMVGDGGGDVGYGKDGWVPVGMWGVGSSDGGAEMLGPDVLLHRFSELAPACRRLLAARP